MCFSGIYVIRTRQRSPATALPSRLADLRIRSRAQSLCPATYSVVLEYGGQKTQQNFDSRSRSAASCYTAGSGSTPGVRSTNSRRPRRSKQRYQPSPGRARQATAGCLRPQRQPTRKPPAYSRLSTAISTAMCAMAIKSSEGGPALWDQAARSSRVSGSGN